MEKGEKAIASEKREKISDIRFMYTGGSFYD
jgi:hypothetical protein